MGVEIALVVSCPIFVAYFGRGTGRFLEKRYFYLDSLDVAIVSSETSLFIETFEGEKMNKLSYKIENFVGNDGYKDIEFTAYFYLVDDKKLDKSNYNITL